MKASDKLLLSFDCTRNYPPETYLEHGSTRVVESRAGKYREAEGSPRGRFAYRFAVEKVGHPHAVIVRYPDDKQRMMAISDGMTYDMTMAIFTGGSLPLSHTMQEARLFFFPRWKDCAVQIITWGRGEPAAAASVEIWELADCAPLQVPGDAGDGSRRELGSQWEDPCGYACAEGALDHAQWVEHVLAYARHSGQNLITYPMSWYYGPQFPSQTNRSDNINILATPDHKLWFRAACEPADWWAGFLKRASEEGVGVMASHTLIRLSSLMEGMNIDLPAIQAGADTYNNLKSNNKVLAGGESPGYLAGPMLERFRHIEEKGGPQVIWDQPAAYPWRETHGPDTDYRPLFNPLHPTTQEKVLEFVGEIVDRYGKWPAFRGVSFNLFVDAVLWFGALDTGYDDYTLKLFQEETCIFRDANYLDQATLNAFAGAERNGAFVFNCYAEDWLPVGFSPDPNDPSLALARDMDGKPADGLVRMNCAYPEDGWWFESQFRIYDSLPSGAHYLEPFAHAVAELDALRITQGGLFMDKCHTDELRRFALAFRALPRQKFQIVGERTDPVAVRTLAADGRRYFYLVNRAHFPVQVRVEFSRDPGAVVDLSCGERIETGAAWGPTLGAYELWSYSVGPEINLVGFETRAPDDIRREILEDARRVLAEIEELGKRGQWIAGMDRLAGQIQRAIKEERLAWLRRALIGYIARKASQMLQDQKG